MRPGRARRITVQRHGKNRTTSLSNCTASKLLPQGLAGACRHRPQRAIGARSRHKRRNSRIQATAMPEQSAGVTLVRSNPEMAWKMASLDQNGRLRGHRLPAGEVPSAHHERPPGWPASCFDNVECGAARRERSPAALTSPGVILIFPGCRRPGFLFP